jgi:diketogulonate reductase-like aldo/keto reductase
MQYYPEVPGWQSQLDLLFSHASHQLDYLDAYLIHFPSSMPGPQIRPPLKDTWQALEALVDKVQPLFAVLLI